MTEGNASMKPKCCYIPNQASGVGCPNDAEWTIWYNEAGRPESLATEARTDHVGHLLTDAPSHTVVPLEAT